MRLTCAVITDTVSSLNIKIADTPIQQKTRSVSVSHSQFRACAFVVIKYIPTPSDKGSYRLLDGSMNSNTNAVWFESHLSHCTRHTPLHYSTRRTHNKPERAPLEHHCVLHTHGRPWHHCHSWNVGEQRQVWRMNWLSSAVQEVHLRCKVVLHTSQQGGEGHLFWLCFIATFRDIKKRHKWIVSVTQTFIITNWTLQLK